MQKQLVGSGEIVGHQDTENAWDIFAQTMKEKVGNIQTLAVEKAHMTVERLEAITEQISCYRSF